MAFGTNDTVVGIDYGETSGATTTTGAAGASAATVGVLNFSSVNDTIYYAGRNQANVDVKIIATANSSGGSTTIVLPDGTTMTLVGLASASGLTFTA